METHLRGGVRRGRVGAFVVAVVVGLSLLAPAASAATHATYPGTTHPQASAPTEDKPQSKLWYQDGSWWGLLLDSSGVFRPHELRPDHTWAGAGAVVDERASSTGDALWDGNRLYVASRTSTGDIRVVRMSYDSARRTYSLDSGFPVRVATGGSESVTIAKDTTGRLWITYTKSSKVWVAHSTTDDRTWTAPFEPPVPDTAIGSDDISAVIAFGGKVGVMWSDQPSNAFRFAIHDDAAAGNAGWSVETPLAGTRMADDHINLRTLLADGAGRLYAALKTSQGDGGEPVGSPSIVVIARDAGGSWTTAVSNTVGDKLTRPALSLDVTNSRLYLFASTEGGGKVYYKSTPLSDLQFANGRGTVLMEAPSAQINNATTSKDPVTAASGLVVLASDEVARRYYHSEIPLGGGTSPAPDTTAPSVPQGLSAVPASASQVNLTWSPSTDNVGVTGYRVLRNGAPVGTATSTSFTDTGVVASTTYRYSVLAFDAAGNTSAPSAEVAVTTPASSPSPEEPEPGTGSIALVGASAAGNAGEAGVTVERPAGVAAGHVLVASVDARGRPEISAPAGWSLVRFDEASTTMRKATFVKVAGAAEPATYTFPLSRAEGATVVLAAYSGVSTSSPVEASAGQVNASSASLMAPSVTTQTAGARLVALFGVARAATVTPPAGMTELGEATATARYVVTGEMADATAATVGATGPRTATASGASTNIGHLIALRPAT